MTTIHLGIDYGTSASKVIIRNYDDPNGESATPLLHSDNTFRIPSDIAYDPQSKNVYLGRTSGDNGVPDSALWFSRLKMVILDQETCPAPPANLTCEMLMAIGMGWVMWKAKKKARELAQQLGLGNVQLSFCVGIPSEFCEAERHHILKKYARIAWAAWDIDVQFFQQTNLQLSNQWIDRIRYLLLRTPAENIVNFIVRSEAQSAIWWNWNAPELTSGPYVQVDVGAGTCNVAAFMIRGKYQPERGTWHPNDIVSFSSKSGSVGMNKMLLSYPHLTRDDFGHSGPFTRSDTLTGLQKPYRETWFDVKNNKTDQNGPAWRQWANHCKLMHFGGGSLWKSIVESLSFNPFMLNQTFQAFSHKYFPQDLKLPPPQNTPPPAPPPPRPSQGGPRPPSKENPRIDKVDPPPSRSSGRIPATNTPSRENREAACNLRVAYGLSVIGGLPEVTGPEHVDRLPPAGVKRPPQDIYSK